MNQSSGHLFQFNGMSERLVFKYCILTVCMLLPGPGFSQDRDSALVAALKCKNTVDITFGGSGLVISANYRRKLLIRSLCYINLSVGAGTVPASGGLTLPHQLSLNLGKKSGFLELGVAGTYWVGTSYSSGFAEKKYAYQFSPLAGYRRHFFNRLVIRGYVNPLFHIAGEYYLEDYRIIPYAGVSIGHSF